MASICPLCEIGALHSELVDESIDYNGTVLHVRDVAISRCDACGEQLVLPEQARANERVFADAKRNHEHLLTSAEICAWRKSLGVTQAEAAKIVGGGVNAFSKYERGEVIQSRPMDLLMRVVAAVPEARAFVFMHAETGHAVHKTVVAKPPRMTDWAPLKDGFFTGVMSSTTRRPAANEELGEWGRPEACYGI